MTHASPPLLITRLEDRAAAVGQRVTLRGVVANTKLPTLVGVDVESESPDLRGQEAIATGILEQQTVTQEEIDAQVAKSGQFPNRGAGVFYRLVDEQTHRLAQVQRPGP